MAELGGGRSGGGIGSVDTSIYRIPENNMFQIAQQATNLARSNVGLQSDQFELQAKRLGYMNSTLSGLLADPDVQKGGEGAMRKIVQEGGRAVALGMFSAKDISNFLSNINPQNPAQSLRQNLLQGLSTQERLNAIYGTPTVINTGNTQQMVRQSPFMGGASPMAGGQFQNQPTPGELLTRVQGPPDATGAPTQRSGLAAGVSEGTLTPAGTINTQPPVPPQRPNPIMRPAGARPPAGNPLVPAAPVPAAVPAPAGVPATEPPSPLPPPTAPQRGVQAPGKPAQTAQTAQQGNPYGSTVTALPPGQTEAMQKTGGAAGDQLAGDRGHAATFTQKSLPLAKAVAALEKLGPTGSGPGQEQLNQFKSFMQTMGIPGFDPNKIKDFDEARKYLVQYASAQNPGGGVTNDRLAAAFAGNPSVGISNAAATDVAKTALSLERMRAAQARAFDATGLPPDQYQKWASTWNGQQDPRAYGIDMLNPAAFNKLRQELQKKPAEYERFKRSYATAKQLGLIGGPIQQGQ